MCNDIQKMNFLGLLDNYTVEIPMLQRDYAQGRDDAKTKELRTNFINDLVNATEKTPLHLDFIYGPVENNTFISLNGHQLKNEIFRPLDGQQRLTTLFLLHWYIAVESNDYELFKTLKKFKYKVRVTTQEFLDEILTIKNVENEALTKENLKDAKWYYSAWDYDPTVQGMLNTIDTIDKKIKNEIPTNINATFNLLEMNEFNLGDELYMRMNARGLALTDFENFKSWLEAHCEKYTDNEYFNNCDSEEKKKNHWTQKIDREWTNLIWDLSDKGANKDSDKSKKENKFDEMFMLFFRGMAQFAIANTDEGEFPEEKEAKNLIAEFSDMNKFISIEQYKKYFNKNILDDCFKFLDFVCNKDNCKHLDGFYFEEDKNLFNRFLKEQTYDDKVLFYALIQYLKNNNWQINDNYNRYKRVIRNLVQNTPISNENFIAAIKSIDNLAVMSNSLLEKIKNSEIKFFDKTQVEEEKLKAELITKNAAWEKEFIEYEKHLYFYGQIGFILEMSKIGSAYNLEKFKRYAKKLHQVFCDDIIQRDDYLLQKALLIQGNYFADFAYNEEIPNKNNSKNNNSLWRNIFKNEFRRNILKQFVDSFTENINSNILNTRIKHGMDKDIDFDYKWCKSALHEIKFPFIAAVTNEYINFHNCKGGKSFHCIYPERNVFYEKITKDLKLNSDIVPKIEWENRLWSYLELNVSDSIKIAIQKGCNDNNLITIGILYIQNVDLKNRIQDTLKEILKGELNGITYPESNHSWACYRQDSWQNNKNNIEKYAAELIEIYNAIKDISIN